MIKALIPNTTAKAYVKYAGIKLSNNISTGSVGPTLTSRLKSGQITSYKHARAMAQMTTRSAKKSKKEPLKPKGYKNQEF